MVRVLKITFLCLAALAVASCDKGRMGEVGTVSFGIAPTVVEAHAGEIGQGDSRAKVTDAFPSGSAIGLRVCAPYAALPISDVYDNFFATFNGATWLYYLDNVNAGDRLSGFSNWNTISVHGYYPYNNTVTDLEEIPFRIADVNGAVAEGTETSMATDYMVAGTQYKDMSVHDPAGTGIPLRFGHLMTAIEFDVNRSISSVPVLKLQDVTFEISSDVTPARKFTVSGNFNAIDPNMGNMTQNITPSETVSKMIVSYPSSPNIISGSVYKILLIMMPELRQTSAADDAVVTMTFRFTDQDGTPYVFEESPNGNPSVTFRLSSVTNGTGNDNGLLAGCIYTVKATLGYITRFIAPTTGESMPPHVNFVGLTNYPDNEFVDI